MAQNFVACDREQELLLPPSLREWLPEGHLAWFVIDAVAQLDLTAFYAAYRWDGHGRPAHDPAMMVALLLYGYAIGERSSRRLERRCVEDVATRVICANQAPDHAQSDTPTSARAGLLEDVPPVVELCDGDPVSELSQAGEAATSRAAVAIVV
jgi:transposase